MSSGTAAHAGSASGDHSALKALAQAISGKIRDTPRITAKVQKSKGWKPR